MNLWIDRSPAMASPQDFAAALREVADYLDTTIGPSTGPIRDSDGVLVGRWEMDGAT